MTHALPHDNESWYLRFHDLMRYRVREVLLVSSPYDAFILEEDGGLTERLFTDYFELNLSTSPRITHAANGGRALKLLDERRFDLVIALPRLSDMDLADFSHRVKRRDSTMPVVLLGFSQIELDRVAASIDLAAIDATFLWTGDSRMLLAIIKLIEDRLNVEHDTTNAGVKVIIVVEDSVQRYSYFLSHLFSRLMTQSQALYAEGLNDLHRLMRMRARPKILLATNYERAEACLRRFRPHVMSLISDVRFPRRGEERADAGLQLVRQARVANPELPVLLLSAEPENREQAKRLGVLYADKNSEQFLRRVNDFLKESLGFGPFIFRLKDRTEVGRAEDVYEMEQVLPDIPAESLMYHGSRNHFSQWLNARSMFRLAEVLRGRGVEEFDDPESMRQHLVEVLRQARALEQDGRITDFSPRVATPESQFIRLGSGSIGGKARGLAFANALLARHGLLDRFPGLTIRIPKTVVIGTDEFDRFLEENPQLEQAKLLPEDREIRRRFLLARLPADLKRDLQIACRDMRCPLAVRSSSLLEDSHLQPFAGIYATHMIPNNHPSADVRLKELCRAIKAVYASTFCRSARAYIRGTPHAVDEEKMGIVIQRLVGQAHDDRFYPHISGVALSHNYYPIGYQQAEEGIVLMALGLGEIIVSEGTALRFSPATPQVLPQCASAADFLDVSQPHFYALELADTEVDFVAGSTSSLRRHPLEVAESDGPLHIVGSVYLPGEDRIRDNLNAPGPRLVTFNNLLKWNAIPLAPALVELLRIGGQGMGCSVEIEFAVDMGDYGSTAMPGRPPCLNVLQIRPQAQLSGASPAVEVDYAAAEILCRTERALGDGAFETISDVVYVTSWTLDSTTTPRVADEVGQINDQLQRREVPYLLVGPGRWGTSDPGLGIPVKWSQIAGVRVIVETPFTDRAVEPSQGTHFFQNVTSFNVGYLTLGDTSALDRAWLDAQPAATETRHVRHVQLPRPLRVLLDGRQGTATILKPAQQENALQP